MKRMLITGATGSVGGELVAKYYGKYELFVQGRDAPRLIRLTMRYPGIHVVFGDLRCHALQEAVQKSNVVIHSAAQKYVDLAEKHCCYTVDTNVSCTHELAELAARKGVERFLFVSTDKCSAPSNVYGMTKYLGERLILELSELYRETTFTICRFGNIFGSNGSVIRLWLEASRQRGEKIRITDPAMTRFMFSVEEAGATIDYALNHGRNGDIIIPKMSSVRLKDLLALFPKVPVEVVGRRPGEKIHETLYVTGETNSGRETEKYYVLNRRSPDIVPIQTMDSSQSPRISQQQLRRWLQKVVEENYPSDESKAAEQSANGKARSLDAATALQKSSAPKRRKLYGSSFPLTA